jgi:NitT/TauT family transport system substrate-binding protein
LNRLLLLIATLAILTLAACAPAAETPDELTPIRLPMGFIPDPQYAPFYVAADKGYFAEEGLAVEFDYSFETDGVALVGAGELPLAVVSGEQVILARAEGLPVVYVLEWFHKYPIALVSKQSAGITSPADLVGREVGVPGFFGASYVGLVGLLNANGLTLDDINASEIGFNQVESLLTDRSESVVVYINNEPVQLEAQGQAIDLIRVSDYLDMVANGIISSEQAIAENPALVQGFVRALMRGTADTLANPDEAYEISKKFVEGLDDSRRNVLQATLPLWESPTPGMTDPDSWVQTQEVLLGMGFIDAPLDDLSAAYTNDFVSAAQP